MDFNKNEDGSDNIAPYSQFTNLTFDPPLVLFSSNQNVIGDRKTTIKTLKELVNLFITWFLMI